MVVSIRSAMVSRFCDRPTFKRSFFKNSPSDHETWSIWCHVGIHVDLHPSWIHMFGWSLKRCIKQTWTGSTFSTNESPCSAMDKGSQSRVWSGLSTMGTGKVNIQHRTIVLDRLFLYVEATSTPKLGLDILIYSSEIQLEWNQQQIWEGHLFIVLHIVSFSWIPSLPNMVLLFQQIGCPLNMCKSMVGIIWTNFGSWYPPWEVSYEYVLPRFVVDFIFIVSYSIRFGSLTPFEGPLWPKL